MLHINGRSSSVQIERAVDHCIPYVYVLWDIGAREMKSHNSALVCAKTALRRSCLFLSLSLCFFISLPIWTQTLTLHARHCHRVPAYGATSTATRSAQARKSLRATKERNRTRAFERERVFSSLAHAQAKARCDNFNVYICTICTFMALKMIYIYISLCVYIITEIYICQSLWCARLNKYCIYIWNR